MAFLVTVPIGFYLMVEKAGTHIQALLIVAASYVIASTGYVSLFRTNRFIGNEQSVRLLLSHNSFSQFAALVVCFALFSFFNLIEFKKIKTAFGLWGILSIVQVLLGGLVELTKYFRQEEVAFFIVKDGLVQRALAVASQLNLGKLPGGHGVPGFIDYASINGCLIACVMPFFISSKRLAKSLVAVLLGITAIILSKSSIPAGVLLVVGLTYAASYYRNSLSLRFGFFLFGLLIVCLFCFRVIDPNLFDSAGRFEAYRLFMMHWLRNANFFTGFGPGSFSVIAPGVQMENGFMVSDTYAHFWLQLHSDWLQVLYEYGFVGLLFALGIFSFAFLSFFKNREHGLLASLVGFGSSCLFNFPLRYAAGSLLVAFLVCYANQLEVESDGGITEAS